MKCHALKEAKINDDPCYKGRGRLERYVAGEYVDRVMAYPILSERVDRAG